MTFPDDYVRIQYTFQGFPCGRTIMTREESVFLASGHDTVTPLVNPTIDEMKKYIEHESEDRPTYFSTDIGGMVTRLKDTIGENNTRTVLTILLDSLSFGEDEA